MIITLRIYRNDFSFHKGGITFFIYYEKRRNLLMNLRPFLIVNIKRNFCSTDSMNEKLFEIPLYIRYNTVVNNSNLEEKMKYFFKSLATAVVIFTAFNSQFNTLACSKKVQIIDFNGEELSWVAKKYPSIFHMFRSKVFTIDCEVFTFIGFDHHYSYPRPTYKGSKGNFLDLYTDDMKNWSLMVKDSNSDKIHLWSSLKKNHFLKNGPFRNQGGLTLFSVSSHKSPRF
jgi:hypothetical protein